MYATRGDEVFPDHFMVCGDCGHVYTSEYGWDGPDKCRCGGDDWCKYVPEEEE